MKQVNAIWCIVALCIGFAVGACMDTKLIARFESVEAAQKDASPELCECGRLPIACHGAPDHRATGRGPTRRAYDPNDAIYKFIPVADKSWTDKFGDTDDTRMKHSISELRVVVAAQGNLIKAQDERLKALETPMDLGGFDVRVTPTVADPNAITNVISFDGEKWRVVEKEVFGVVCTFLVPLEPYLADPNEVKE